MSHRDDTRPDPEALLRAITRNGEDGVRPQLKIFFGMAAGSGKTYAMLTAAHKAMGEGVDVVAGYIESHGRADIERLADGIPSIPRRKTVYRGVALEEMDTDAVIARHPAIALVDELAHTNAPESRHPKRFQDVLELLDAGISVYTTLNVQHIESRAGTVREITGIPVRETLPDSVLERADEIEIIDISPEDLIKRLREGKIYPPERIEMAAGNFFEIGNLTALREMALRFTAEKVDHSLQSYRQTRKIYEPWKTGERLLVAVSPSPFSESLVRWTRRMAYNLGASWIAVNVETSKPLSVKDRKRLNKIISLARELGAEIVVTRDEDITGGILRIARQRNITQIVAGKPGSGSWRDIFRFRTPVRRLIKESGNIDLYIIRAPGGNENAAERRTGYSWKKPRWKQYLAVLSALAGVAAANYAMLPIIGARSVSLILLLSILIVSLFVGRGPVFFYAALSALVWNFFFLPPYFTLYIYRIDDVIIFIMYFTIALVAGSLTSKMRNQERSAVQREEQLNVLYDVTRRFASSRSIDEAIEYVLAYIKSTFEALAVVYIKSADGSLSATPHPASSIIPDEKDFSVANYCFTSGKTAGRFTDTLPSSPFLFIPLFFKKENTVGVMGIRFSADILLTLEETAMLETLASHLANVIERDMFVQETQKTKIHEESEKLYRVLMNSLTHEIRTPLTAIKGSISTLMDTAVHGNEHARHNLLKETQDAAERLIALVDNLLDMSRIDSGRISLNADWNDLSDIIGSVLNKLEFLAARHPITVWCPDDIPLVRVDYTLIAQALYCIVHNAIVHTHDGTPVRIGVARYDNGVSIVVEDDGPGLPADDIGKLFDKFYRSGKTQSRMGLGLGLSISRGIVELHGGRITAENKAPHGARFVMYLPVAVKEKESD